MFSSVCYYNHSPPQPHYCPTLPPLQLCPPFGAKSHLKSHPPNLDHLLLLFLLFVSAPRLTFAGPLEAAEQRNCLLSRVDFSCACKLLCIDTLSEAGRHTGPGRSPHSGRAADPRGRFHRDGERSGGWARVWPRHGFLLGSDPALIQGWGRDLKVEIVNLVAVSSLEC